MSSYNRNNEIANPHSRADGSNGSRKSSLATQSTIQTHSSATGVLDSGLVNEQDDSDTVLPRPGPIDFASVQQDGLKYCEDTVGGRQWLFSFGLHKAETDVSLLLRTDNAIGTSQGPYSLLPLFAQLAQSWYAIARKRRKADKLPRSVSFQEQDDFDWLLQYIADYLGIGHDFFDEAEQFQLCNSLTDICQDTSRASDIDACISILYVMIMHSTFPKNALREALDVLCAATIILTDPPAALSDCFRLLLTGPVHEDAVSILLEFSVTPTVQNNSQKMTCGRGAWRQLSLALDAVDYSGENVVGTDKFVGALHQASKCCIFRYCSEVMKACHALLNSARTGRVLTEDFDRITGSVDNCVRTLLPRSPSTRSLGTVNSPDREQVVETEKQNAKYLSERNQILKTLLHDFERVWKLLSETQQHRIADFFMDHSKELTDCQASIAIAFFRKQGFVGTNGGEATLRVSKVFESFIRNTKIFISTRLQAIELCAETATNALTVENDQGAESTSTLTVLGQNIVDRLLNALGTEHNTTMVSAILTTLTNLVFESDSNGKFIYAELVTRKLLWFVKNERDGGDDLHDDHVVLFTRHLQDVFLKSIHQAPVIALRTFDALLDIASTSTKSRKCRIVALRLLLRIRCDTNGMIYLQKEAESQYIAVALCRTDSSREAFNQDPALPQRPPAGHSNIVHFTSPRQLWSYPEETTHTQEWNSSVSTLVGVKGRTDTNNPASAELRISNWLVKVIECLQSDNDWETYSFIIVHLGAQLFNTKLFSANLEVVVKLRQVLCTQIINNSFKEPPVSTGLKRSDAALCVFNMLTALIPYATLKSESIQKGFGDDLVRAFLSGVGGTWEGTSRGCIHALCICCFEVPSSVAGLYPGIVSKMSKNMTQSHLTIHILEFLAQVARLPEVHTNFTQDEITMIFGLCVQFLEKARESPSPRVGTPARHSGLTLRRPPYRAAMLYDEALPQYASALAYHTMIFWFLSLKLEVRAKYVSWIVPRLVWKTGSGDETLDEQSQVFIDMMQRTAFSDLGETKPDPMFAAEADGAVSSSSWIVGLSVITAETAGHTGITQITKRQASGTTHAIYRQLTAPLPSHHVPSDTEIRPEDSRYGATSMLPPHILLQMVTSAAPTSVADQPIPLPQEDFVARSLNVFDKIPTVDGHKIGVLYLARGQVKDTEFLANQAGSENYSSFLHGLGYTVSLSPPLDYNPQGLQHPRDGQHTLAFRDRVTEIVYHVPTMMPNNLEEDPSCNMKKAHVGNCHVVVVFNESDLTWEMDNFPSQVTFVHVVITPANRGHTAPLTPTSASAPSTNLCDFYHVHVLTKENHPNVTPAADPKIISREMLPGFVRMLALNANLCSQAKVADDSDDNEFTSSWRARLQQIKRLKQRATSRPGEGPYGHASPFITAPSTVAGGGRRTPVGRDDQSRSDDGDPDGLLASQLDFGKWTL